jgi:hypothetical protein
MFDRSSPRRSFLARAAAAVASIVAVNGLERPGAVIAQAKPGPADPDRWLDDLKGKHRCLFDFPGHGMGFPQIHMLNFIETYQSAYGVPAADLNAVGTCYGAPGGPASMPIAWNDAMWAKYKIGDIVKVTDPATKGPALRNMFFRPMAGDPVFLNGKVMRAAMENLQKLGCTFIMCNNSFLAWVGFLAGQGMGKTEDIEREIRANLIPGVVTVPAMVIAIERAQARGLAYNRQV